MKKSDVDLMNFSSKGVIFMIIMTIIAIYMVDGTQLYGADPEREKVWRIMLSLFSILVICITAYMMNLRLTGKLKKIYMATIIGSLYGSIVAIGFSYLGYEGAKLGLFFMTRSLLIGYMLALVYDWHRKTVREATAQKQQLHSELNFLKSQINPHFLFNTLNNIDSLIKSNPDKASGAVIELSDMMRYMIYDTSRNRVLLSKEIGYIDDFLRLQKLQFANPEMVGYKVSGDAGELTIAPMLFIPFIENAFKHCTDKEKDNAISIKIEIDTGSVHLDVVNLYNPGRQMNKDKIGGIGLDVVKRRLELIYPGRYKLAIESKNDLFCVSLTIQCL